jgi:tetrahydromethanopterin S-methyltransferase subunit D
MGKCCFVVGIIGVVFGGIELGLVFALKVSEVSTALEDQPLNGE